MAVDTAAKRASSVQLLAWSVLAPPFPNDGAIDQPDRQHTAHTYRGVLAWLGHEIVYATIDLGALAVTRTVTAALAVARTIRGDLAVTRTVTSTLKGL